MNQRAGLAIFLAASTSAFSAQEDAFKRDLIDPLRVTCVLREQKFFTEILFTTNSAGELNGEVDNYMSLPSHGRKFLSGSVLFDITSSETEISGNTGDRRGIVNRFRLYPKTNSRTGIWSFEQTESNGSVTKARFRCSYAD